MGFALSQFWRPEIRGQGVGLVGSFLEAGRRYLLRAPSLAPGDGQDTPGVLSAISASAQGRPLRVSLRMGVNLITPANSLFPRKAPVYTSQ